MNTKCNVGNTVYLEVKIEEINIDRNGTTYCISFKNYFDKWVKEDKLNAEA